MTRIIFSIIFLFFCLRGHASSPPPEATVRQLQSIGPKGGCSLKLMQNPAEANIAEEFAICVELSIPAGASLKSLDIPIQELKNLEQKQVSDQPIRILNDGSSLILREFLLDAQLSDEGGSFVLPSITARVMLSDGKEVELSTEEHTLALVTPTEQELIVQSPNTPFSTLLTPQQQRKRLCNIILCMLVLLLALAGAAYWLRRRQHLLQESIPPPSPYLIAVQRLDQLLEQALPDSGLFKEYYTGLSAILREYIEGRYQINAPNLTTEEFLHSLTKRKIEDLQDFRALLQQFLTECDLVKFAEQRSSAEQSERLAQCCRQFLDATRPPVTRLNP